VDGAAFARLTVHERTGNNGDDQRRRKIDGCQRRAAGVPSAVAHRAGTAHDHFLWPYFDHCRTPSIPQPGACSILGDGAIANEIDQRSQNQVVRRLFWRRQSRWSYRIHRV